MNEEIKMKRTLLVSMNLFLLFFFTAGAQASEFIIERHIVNHSTKPWTVSFSFIKGSIKYKDSNETSMVINPGVDAPIQYISLCGRETVNNPYAALKELCFISGTVTITDSEGKSQYFKISNRWFGGYIQHDGNTGSVVLNGLNNSDKLGGEIDFIADSWGDYKQSSGFRWSLRW